MEASMPVRLSASFAIQIELFAASEEHRGVGRFEEVAIGAEFAGFLAVDLFW
jgi:hypothetical protein